MSPACTRPKDSMDPAPKPKIAKVDKEKNGSRKEEEHEGQQPSIKDLLKEAKEMLKTMNVSSPTSSSTSTTPKGGDQERSEITEKLRQQLNALRQKAFKIRRMKKGERQGLLDSGATHPLRPLNKGEDVTGFQKVQVALADGQVIKLPISPGALWRPKTKMSSRCPWDCSRSTPLYGGVEERPVDCPPS